MYMFSVIATLGLVFAILHRIFSKIAEEIALRHKRSDVTRDIPCEHCHWFYGNGRYFSADEQGFKNEIDTVIKYPTCYQRWFGPFRLFVTGHHSDSAKALLSTNTPKNEFQFFRPWIGDGLLTSNGEKWRRSRRLLTPLFHFECLKRYLPCTNDVAMDMMDRWKSDMGTSGSRSIEMFEEVSSATLDNLLRCLFSKTSGCQTGEAKRYLKAVTRITRSIVQRIRNPFHHTDFLYFLSSAGREYRRELKIAHDFTEKAIRERVSEINMSPDYKPSTEYDFLDVLLMAKDEDDRGMCHKEIRDELDTFVFEGHDTVTSGISWAFYNLALYPEQQEKCRNEVLSVLGGAERVDWCHLPKLSHLTKFIKESMRLFPPVTGVARMTKESTILPRGFGTNDFGPENDEASQKVFPKSTRITVRIFALHRNPQLWENPEAFDPERFDPENMTGRSPHAYVPFSSGPRNCIGQNFAMNEMKVLLAIALTKFKFTIDTSYPLPKLEDSVILRSKTGIHLMVEAL